MALMQFLHWNNQFLLNQYQLKKVLSYEKILFANLNALMYIIMIQLETIIQDP